MQPVVSNILLGVTSAALGIVAVAGCGGSGAPAATATPQALLTGAKGVLDRSPSVHFVLTSTGATGKGTVIAGGTGDVARPDTLRGQFTVAEAGFTASVGVLAGGGRFYVELPFTSTYTRADPSSYGIGDPVQLISPTNGLSRLLLAIDRPRSAGTTRIGGEVVDQVEGTVPGASVPVLPDANRSAAVAVEADILPSSHQLRRISLQGPFTSATTSTYTVVLTDYGEAVHVDLPGA